MSQFLCIIPPPRLRELWGHPRRPEIYRPFDSLPTVMIWYIFLQYTKSHVHTLCILSTGSIHRESPVHILCRCRVRAELQQKVSKVSKLASRPAPFIGPCLVTKFQIPIFFFRHLHGDLNLDEIKTHCDCCL